MAFDEAVCHVPGFSFENFQRNKYLETQGYELPKATKTGTTIVGVVFADGVVLGADTRATEGSIIADKNCTKIHYLADNMYCCGAGTAADTCMTTRMVGSQLRLMKLNTGREVQVVTANKILQQFLFRYQGHIGAALILGGFDSTGPNLFSIHPHGSTEKGLYLTMGSGSLAAMAVLETKWKPDMTEAEAKVVVSEAIQAGIFNDAASGSNVDLCVIKKGSVDYIRPHLVANQKGKRHNSYRYAEGTTAVLKKTVIPLVVESIAVKPLGENTMDVSG